MECISGIDVVRSTYGAARGFTLFNRCVPRKSVGQNTGRSHLSRLIKAHITITQLYNINHQKISRPISRTIVIIL